MQRAQLLPHIAANRSPACTWNRVAWVVDNLRRPEDLVPALENLGARHVDYGAEEDHYPAVGATLLKSLAEIAGDLWNEELNAAWADAYDEIARHMLNGAGVVAV